MGGHGGRRLGAGRPRKSLEAHRIAGTYQASRHGPLPNVLAMPAPSLSAAWEASETDVASLTPAGRAFVAQMAARYEFSLPEGALLLEAGHAVDGLTWIRSQARDGLSLTELATRDRIERSWTATLAALLAQLKAT